MFVALSHRNFRLLWIGLLVSFSGTFMQSAAVLWHVSMLVPADRRAIALGLVGLVRIFPVILFSMISGVAADAFDRRKLMLGTQTIMAILAGVLALLTFRGLTAVWPIYLLTAISAAAGAFDLPARQALTPNLVPREHLPNAITLNSIMLQTASVGGPALGGLILATHSVAWVYTSNAVSFLFVIGALLAMDPPRHDETAAADRSNFTIAAALEGLRFVFRAPLIRSTMLLDFLATFFASATALLPIFAQDILHVGARGYGWLYAAPAAGSLLMSAAMIRIVDWIERRGEVLIAAVAVHGRCDGRLRFFAGVLAQFSLPGGHRRGGHGQHDVPQPDSATRNPRSPARPDDGGEHGLLHRRPAARRAGSRPGRELARRRHLRRHRRAGLRRRHGMDRGSHTGVARVSPPGSATHSGRRRQERGESGGTGMSCGPRSAGSQVRNFAAPERRPL